MKRLLSLVALMGLLVGCDFSDTISGIDWSKDYTDAQLTKYELSIDDTVDTVDINVTAVRTKEAAYYYSKEINSKSYIVYIDVSLVNKHEITITIDNVVRYKGTYLEYGGLTDTYIDNITITLTEL